VIHLLDSPVRAYAWGSRTAIAQVQGRPSPTDEPEAELWVGAHPAAPSRLAESGRPLTEAIEADATAMLGDDVVRSFGARLPFLLKLLAAEAPLSIQAHPDATTARAGFAAEEAAGVPRDDPKRNYADPFPKPELLYAVTEFSALCGFRAPSDTLALLARLDAPLLDDLAAELVARPDAEGLRGTVTRLLTLPDTDRADLVGEVLAACRAVAGAPYALAVDLGERYPGDVGAVLSLLLNIVRLRPGQAIHLPAGVPHAYLRGLGVETMANSDNVLRGGLTPKWVDVSELLRVLRCTPGAVAPLEPVDEGPGVRSWRPPVAEFALTRVILDDAVRSARLPAAGPRALLCLDGRVDADGTALGAGQSAFESAGEGLHLRGAGTLFVAGTPGARGDR
jgi:mannose-6-phosphate isomerase